jgi:periplasmic divalent cation tolerance protein
MDCVLVLVTAPSEEEAAKMAKALVEERLAACANIVKGVRSIYRWEGEVQDDPEVLMLIKTTGERFEALKSRVKALHSYSVPEVIALPIVKGLEAYLEWIGESTS